MSKPIPDGRPSEADSGAIRVYHRCGGCLDVWESQAHEDSVAGHNGANCGFLTRWVFSRKKDICVAVMYNNVTEAADEGMDDLACEIYKNAKE